LVSLEPADTSWASPKSITIACPVLVTITLAGLTSRCTIAFAVSFPEALRNLDHKFDNSADSERVLNNF